MITRKFTVAIILLNINKYLTKHHGYQRLQRPRQEQRNNFNYYLPISRSRQLYSTENQGRNFFMEKLCELGLGECPRNDPASSIQLVQPVQVIPVGQPIAAVAADYAGDESEDRLFNLFGGSRGPSLNILGGLTPSKGGGGRPSYKPRPSYGAPKPSYKPTNPRPSSGYGVPKAPPISSGYGVPKAPAISSGYGVPQAPAIGSGYGVPQGPALTSGYRGPAPSSSFSIPQVSNQNNINSFTSPDSYQAQKRPNRESAETYEECYCTQQSACPSSNVIQIANYSTSIDPRVKDKNIQSLALELLLLQSLERRLSRRKRSPDGQHHHHHHDGNIDLTHLDQEHHTEFGPNGPRPPFCGGPGSGYVCCRSASSVPASVSALPAVDFNELGDAEDLLRNIRQQHQQFSKFAQCGRRNAHSVQGRIRNEDILSLLQERQDADLDLALNALDKDPAASEIVRKIRKIRRKKQGGSNDVSSSSPSSRGTTVDADFGEYPWQAAILQKDQYDNIYTCGAALIDPSHLITATHCINKFRPEQLRVRLGEWDVHSDSEPYTNVEMDVLDIKYHPEFHAGNLYNDIAVVKLDGVLDFQENPHISPVCLPDVFQDFSDHRCWVSGWGKDQFGVTGAYQNILKEVDVPVMSHGQCQQQLRQTRLGQQFLLHPGFLCAGGEEGKDACKGDGGSPLVCQMDGVWQLAGIVSWGVGCGTRDIPGVYVRVGHYTDWIQEMILQG